MEFHPPPVAPTLSDDTEHPKQWQDMFATVLTRLDDRIEAFWNEE